MSSSASTLGLVDERFCEVGDREAVEQVVVRPHAAAAHRQRRRAGLILHAVPVRVAAAHHGRHRDRHQERVAAHASGSDCERLAVQHFADRRVRRFDERRLAGDRDRFLDGADLELKIERHELLRADASCPSARTSCKPCTVALIGVARRVDRRERVLARRRSSPCRG